VSSRRSISASFDLRTTLGSPVWHLLHSLEDGLRLIGEGPFDRTQTAVRLGHVDLRLDSSNDDARASLSRRDRAVRCSQDIVEAGRTNHVAVDVVTNGESSIKNFPARVDTSGDRDEDAAVGLGRVLGGGRGGRGVGGGGVDLVELLVDLGEVRAVVDHGRRLGHRTPCTPDEGDENRENAEADEGPDEPEDPGTSIAVVDACGRVVVVAVVADDQGHRQADLLLRDRDVAIDGGSHELNLRRKKKNTRNTV